MANCVALLIFQIL